MKVKLCKNNFSGSNNSDGKSVNEGTRDNNSWQVHVQSEVQRETNQSKSVTYLRKLLLAKHDGIPDSV